MFPNDSEVILDPASMSPYEDNDLPATTKNTNPQGNATLSGSFARKGNSVDHTIEHKLEDETPMKKIRVARLKSAKRKGTATIEVDKYGFNDDHLKKR